jgi:hypothetical protein
MLRYRCSARRPTGITEDDMIYPRRSLVAALIVVLALPFIASGQPANQSADILPFLRTNPLLTSLNQVAPESTRPVILRLERIGRSQQSTLRAPDDPSPAEQAQIAANPAFAQAYQNQPQQALRLLRDVNGILRRSAH